MSEQRSSPVVMDTSASRVVGGPVNAGAFARTERGGEVFRGDLPAGTVLEREILDVTRPGSAFRELAPGGLTIKAGV